MFRKYVQKSIVSKWSFKYLTIRLLGKRFENTDEGIVTIGYRYKDNLLITKQIKLI